MWLILLLKLLLLYQYLLQYQKEKWNKKCDAYSIYYLYTDTAFVLR